MIIDSSAVQILLATTQAKRAEVFDVRIRVFVEEQGVPVDIEMDELDATADHFLGRLDGKAAGAGRLVIVDGVGVLGRLAVLPETRGTGLGVALVKAIEKRAADRGLAILELHAQTHARGFYVRLGYEAEGEEYLEAGIPHISMRKKL